jgi:hypothetical protein
MRKLIAIFGVLLLTGCAGIISKIPSFWDDNQSAKITDVRLSIERIDCASSAVQAQVAQVRDQLLWFELYSESKGLRQRDVILLIHPVRETAEDMYKRYESAQASKGYCEIKTRILKAQSSRAAAAILGRY